MIMYRAVFTLIFINLCVPSSQIERARDDLDAYLTTPQIIRRHGYPSEAHVVQTEDGYLLTLHRIPRGRVKSRNPRKVVFLQHALFSSSADWVFNGPNRSLAYILADENYDVWLGNARGSTYSRAHASLFTKDPNFWNFSFHEMGVMDLTAVTDYILSMTKQGSLFYVGHSLGTTIFFTMASVKPEYGLKYKGMFGLGVAAYLNHVKSPIRLLAPLGRNLQYARNIFGDGELLPHNPVTQYLTNLGCRFFALEREICANLIFIVAGFDRSQFNMSMMPILQNHNPAGISTKTLIHFAQQMDTGKFRNFDYGRLRNLIIYGTTEPPEYNVSAITTPMAFYYATNDWLSNPIDVRHLYEKMKNRIGMFRIDYPEFNHLDFLWAKDAKTLVYDHMLNIMNTL